MSRIVHFEIHATNPDKLSAFYAKVFDWKVAHLPQLNYWLFETGSGDGINGGMMSRTGSAAPEGAPVNAFVCSVGVTSLDQSLKRALEAGATIALPKMAIPGVGHQVYIKDPDGNIVGIHQPDRKAV